MSIILGLDSSTDACSVSLNIKGEIRHHFELAAKSHTQRLLPLVDQILAEADLKLSQLDAIAFGRGPGSFTGLRICMGVVQGLAFGADLPVIPVSTLASMALDFHWRFPNINFPVLPCLDARMNEVYWALYRIEDGLPVLDGEEAVCAPQALVDLEKIQRMQNQFAVIGQGWHYPAIAQLNPLVKQDDVHPTAAAIVKIAADLFEKGQTESILTAQPVYLRDSVSWQKRPAARRHIQID